MRLNVVHALLTVLVINAHVLIFSPRNQQDYLIVTMATGEKPFWPPGTKLTEADMTAQIKKLQEQLSAATLETKPKTSPTFLLMPSQKKLASYLGSADAILKLEDWICDVKASIRSRPLSENDKVDFVFQHLTGPAREEVKFRPHKSVDDIFVILREVFGDQGSSVHLQRAFFEKKQAVGENIRDFSHALLDLFDRACRKSPRP